MGRQIAVVLSLRDEELLIDRASAKGPIQIFESFASSPDALRVDRFDPTLHGHFSYRIWPTRFAWQPVYAQASTGNWYLKNASTAPILEYSRVPLKNDEPGRLYWAGAFSGTPDYDLAGFSKWIDSIFRWVRHTATNRAFGKRRDVWVFPDALSATP